jgi:hypothetical protein
VAGIFRDSLCLLAIDVSSLWACRAMQHACHPSEG